jgi:hypothetical protein
MSRKHAPARVRAEDQNQLGYIGDEYEQFAEMEREQAARELGAAPGLALTVSNVAEVAQASAALDRVRRGDDDMQLGLSMWTVPGEHLVANEHAKNVLGDFLVSSGEQARVLTDFQVQYRQLVLDGARLAGMELHWRAQGGGRALDDGTMVERVRAMELRESAFGTEKSMLRGDHRELASAVVNVGVAEHKASASSHALTGKLAEIQAGLVAREQAAPEERAKLAALRAKIDRLKGYVATGIDLAAKGAGKLGAPEKLLKYAKEPIAFVSDALIDSHFEAELDELEGHIAVADTHQHDAAAAAQIKAVRQAKSEYLAHLAELQAALIAVRELKNSLDEKAGQLALHAEHGGDGELAAAAKLFVEADRVAAQCGVVLGLGQAEMEAAGYATGDRKKIDAGSGARLPTFEPYTTGGRGRIRDRRHDLVIEERDREQDRRYRNEGNRPKAKLGYSEGQTGANPVVARMMEDVAAERARIEALRDELARSLDLGKM